MASALRSRKAWVGIAVSVVAIVYAVRGVEWRDVGAALVGADYGVLAAVFVLSPIVNILTRAVRWKILMAPSAPVTTAGCVSATAIGLMANNVLPARIGEFVRAYALGKRERVPTGTAFGSLFVERMFDGFSVLAILYALTWLHVLPGWVHTTVRVAFYIFGGFLLFQIALVLHPERVVRLARWTSRRAFGERIEEAIGRTLVTFIDGFRLLKRPWLVVVSAVLALVQWTLLCALFLLGLVAFDLGGVGWTGGFFANCVVSLGVAVPSSPGFVGTYQAFVVKSLEVFEVGRSEAFSFSVGYQAASFLSVTLVGLWYFAREGLTWGELESSEEVLEHDLDVEYETEIEPGAGAEGRDG